MSVGRAFTLWTHNPLAARLVSAHEATPLRWPPGRAHPGCRVRRRWRRWGCCAPHTTTSLNLTHSPARPNSTQAEQDGSPVAICRAAAAGVPDLVKQAKALQARATTPEECGALYLGGAAEALWAAASLHRSSVDAQLWCCAALGDLSLNFEVVAEPQRKRSAALTGCEAAVAALRAHPDAASLQEEACRCVANLAVLLDDRVQAVASAGLDAVVGALKQHLAKPGTAEEALRALANITGVSDAVQVKAAAAGAVELCLLAVKTHTDTQASRKWASPPSPASV